MVCWGCIVGGLLSVVDVVSGSHSAWETQRMGIAGSAGFCSERVVVCGTCNAWGLQCMRVALCEIFIVWELWQVRVVACRSCGV